ncbi:hypothetical protein COCON_G00050370 [Conger conger]|uniref:Uncharacterized protein n=1 Tax=Conger conger TaxID=82655 RepID=A0A9Q1DVJ3_CONCO|nr:hypothetical protein COCON_G00050370 [Conger conger]
MREQRQSTFLEEHAGEVLLNPDYRAQLLCTMSFDSPSDWPPRIVPAPTGERRRGDAGSGFPRRRGPPHSESRSRPPGNTLSTQTGSSHGFTSLWCSLGMHHSLRKKSLWVLGNMKDSDGNSGI